MKRTRMTIKNVESLPAVCAELKAQGWTERPFSTMLPSIKGATEKLICYVWRWHGCWSGASKEYCTTFYR